MIIWKQLSPQETERIYEEHMKQDFPPLELKPLKTILTLLEEGTYRTMGYYEDGQLIGYSYLCHHRDEKIVLLDYLAVVEGKRGCGYGKQILQNLQEIYANYDAILLEVENPDYAENDQELQQRTRRIQFYEYCGTLYEGQTGKVFDVDYRVLQLPCKRKLNRGELRRALIEIYRALVQEPAFTKKVLIHEI